MSKRRRGKRVFPRRMASDYINTGQRPRVTIFDEEVESIDQHIEKSTLRDLALKHGIRKNLTLGELTDLVPGDYWFDNKGRVRSVVGRRDQMSPKTNNTFTKEVPTTVRSTVVRPVYNEDTGQMNAEVPRRSVEKLLRIFQSKLRGQGVEEWHYITLAKTATYHLKLFNYGTKYRLVEEDYKTRVARRSYIYGSKWDVLDSIARKSVGWVEAFTLAEDAEVPL